MKQQQKYSIYLRQLVLTQSQYITLSHYTRVALSYHDRHQSTGSHGNASGMGHQFCGDMISRFKRLIEPGTQRCEY